MFFKLTPDKVINRVNRLIDELGTYDARIKEHEDDAALALSAGIARPGDDFAIREWRAVYDDMYETLAEARYGIQSGQIDFSMINRVLPTIKPALKNLRRVLDETDKLKAFGRAAAKQRLRNLNAQN